ncbi:MAG: response regulator, partial [Calditrichaeota bacterium]|nr:response regulator [Calditrichota bacterium]
MGNMIQKVLIADDSAIARSIVRRVLEAAGFENLEIREADCGEKALEMLKQSPAELVLTDLN